MTYLPWCYIIKAVNTISIIIIIACNVSEVPCTLKYSSLHLTHTPFCSSFHLPDTPNNSYLHLSDYPLDSLSHLHLQFPPSTGYHQYSSLPSLIFTSIVPSTYLILHFAVHSTYPILLNLIIPSIVPSTYPMHSIAVKPTYVKLPTIVRSIYSNLDNLS